MIDLSYKFLSILILGLARLSLLYVYFLSEFLNVYTSCRSYHLSYVTVKPPS